MLDDEGYPTEEFLEELKAWDPKNFGSLMETVGKAWRFESGFRPCGARTWELATGGWSGNESIIHALQDNFMFWSLCWQESKRGGYYRFVIPKAFIGPLSPQVETSCD